MNTKPCISSHNKRIIILIYTKDCSDTKGYNRTKIKRINSWPKKWPPARFLSAQPAILDFFGRPKISGPKARSNPWSVHGDQLAQGYRRLWERTSIPVALALTKLLCALKPDWPSCATRCLDSTCHERVISSFDQSRSLILWFTSNNTTL